MNWCINNPLARSVSLSSRVQSPLLPACPDLSPGSAEDGDACQGRREAGDNGTDAGQD